MYACLYVHKIVVTQGRVHCLICTHDAQRRVWTLGHCVHISGYAYFSVLQLLCFTCSEAAVLIASQFNSIMGCCASVSLKLDPTDPKYPIFVSFLLRTCM